VVRNKAGQEGDCQCHCLTTLQRCGPIDVYGVIDDAEHERKLFVRAKNNVAAKSKNKTLAFRFTAREVGTDKKSGKPIWAPHIIWDPQYVDVSASEARQAASDSKSPAALRGKIERDGPCPICGGDDRFSISTRKQVFNCRGCKAAGDVIDLVRFLDGTEFIEACTTLAGKPPKANGNGHATNRSLRPL
jgi:hypothetical protein